MPGNTKKTARKAACATLHEAVRQEMTFRRRDGARAMTFSFICGTSLLQAARIARHWSRAYVSDESPVKRPNT